LGLAPQSDGKVIRLNIPPLSGEVRRKMVARTKELAEETKVAIRNIRRDANKQADQEQKDKDLTEDERDTAHEAVQKLVKKFEDKSNDLAKAKESEVMDE
jgi:ribosome recycling factor